MKMKHLFIAILVTISTGACGQHEDGNNHGHGNGYGPHRTKGNLSDSVVTFPTVGFKKVHEDTIEYSPEKVFKLLEPGGRNLLYANWNPTVLKEGENGTFKGQVLFSNYEEMDVMLTVREHLSLIHI